MKVGDRVSVKWGLHWVPCYILEDRGPLAGNGVTLFRVALEELEEGVPPLEFETSIEKLRAPHTGGF
jgi:hypothetical protein